MAACGKEETSGQGEAQWNSGDYQREFLPVEQGDMFFADIILADGWAGYQYSGTNADGTRVSGIRLCSLIDKTVRDCSLSVQSGEYLEKYTPDGNGGIYAVLSLQSGADGEDGSREYYLAEIDFDGKKVGSVYRNLNTGNNIRSLSAVSGGIVAAAGSEGYETAKIIQNRVNVYIKENKS